MHLEEVISIVLENPIYFRYRRLKSARLSVSCLMLNDKCSIRCARTFAEIVLRSPDIVEHDLLGIEAIGIDQFL